MTAAPQPVLSGVDRTYLRGVAHHLQPIVQIGKAGLTPQVLAAIEQALEHHELIKIRFLAYKEEKRQLSQHIAQTLHSELIGLVGHVSMFYRQHPEPDKRKIQLPSQTPSEGEAALASQSQRAKDVAPRLQRWHNTGQRLLSLERRSKDRSFDHWMVSLPLYLPGCIYGAHMVAAEREEPAGALHGIRVLDVAEPLGAYVSRILGDLGADVVKIEPPQGDLSRRVAPFLSHDHELFSLPFLHSNVNKRSIILDFEQQQEQERFHALAAQADIVVSTQSAATWARRGIDLQCLSQRFPRLIWTSLSPFGLSGPYSEYVGNNFIAEAMGGLMYIQGDDAQAPCVSPYEQGMHLASLHAAFGALMALWERRSSGLGQVVEVSVQEVVAHIYYIPVRYAYLRDILRRTGARNPQPANGYYRCKDGHVFICILLPHHWDRLVELMADPLLADPAFRDRDYRQANADLIETRLGQFAARFERWALTTAMQHRGLPVAPVSTVADLAANEHLAARRLFYRPGAAALGTITQCWAALSCLGNAIACMATSATAGRTSAGSFRCAETVSPQ